MGKMGGETGEKADEIWTKWKDRQRLERDKAEEEEKRRQAEGMSAGDEKKGRCW